MDQFFQTKSNTSVLCVDLDGTIIDGDLLFESAIALIAKNPLYIFLMVFWLAKGKAVLKKEIALRIDLNVKNLKYRKDIVDYVKEKRDYFLTVLCTASDEIYAKKVSDYLGLFDVVIASDGKTNLSGAKKAEKLNNIYGEYGFSYIGDSIEDIHVFEKSKYIIVANDEDKIVKNIKSKNKIIAIFPRSKASRNDWLKAIRVHQWVKNILVFLPLMAAHLFLNSIDILKAFDGAISLSLLASSAYILNDLMDIEADRQHPHKSSRPFAKGVLSIKSGVLACIGLATAGFVLAFPLGLKFIEAVSIYYSTTIAYSSYFKKIAILDVIILAGLYTLRIIAGTAAIAVPLSFWLLAFSMFIFLSLAMLKRYTELSSLIKSGKNIVDRRGYSVDDISIIQNMGCSSGYISVMVMALYINSPNSSVLYQHPHVLWLLCPLLLYWISRIWFLAKNGKVHHDPVVFAIKDPGSLIIIGLCALSALGAML